MRNEVHLKHFDMGYVKMHGFHGNPYMIFENGGRYRGRQPAGPAGGGATLVVLARCSMSCNGQLEIWRPGGVNPPCVPSTKFVVELCLLIKTSTWSLLREQDPPGHQTTHSIAGPRFIVMP